MIFALALWLCAMPAGFFAGYAFATRVTGKKTLASDEIDGDVYIFGLAGAVLPLVAAVFAIIVMAREFEKSGKRR